MRRSLFCSAARLPNPRVQRTRSSASPPHSPLTRHPLGRNGKALGAGVLMSLIATQALVPCSRYGAVDSKATVRGATVIVIATAVAYVRESGVERRSEGEGLVRFVVR